MKRLNALLRSFRNMKVQVQYNIINIEYYTDQFIQLPKKHFNSCLSEVYIWQTECL